MKILVEVHSYNRKSIATECFNHINSYRDTNSHFRIIDDYSTEYDTDYLKNYCDSTFRWETKLTINRLMYRSFKLWHDEDWDFVYHTDIDCIHDPYWYKMLFILYNQSGNLPITLYRSSFIESFGAGVSKVLSYTPQGILKSGLFGGCSVLLDKKMINQINDGLPKTEDEWALQTTNTAWDSQIQQMINPDRKYLVPYMSLVQHIGTDGQNHKTLLSDIAVNPTPYLKKYLENLL